MITVWHNGLILLFGCENYKQIVDFSGDVSKKQNNLKHPNIVFAYIYKLSRVLLPS
jgi:pterin-4a-carbinolamine dehydratase